MFAKSLFSCVGTLLVAFHLQNVNAGYDAAEYCPLVPVGTQFPSFKSCQNFYTCQPDGQVSSESCAGKDKFDKDLQKCVPASQSKCVHDNPCAGRNSQFASDPKDCKRYNYCVNGQISGSNRCPDRQKFDGTACVYGDCKNDDQRVVEIKSVCEIMQNKQFFGDMDACNKWQQCVDGQLKTGNCLENLVYNSQNRMCLKDDEKTTMCGERGGDKKSKDCTSGTPPKGDTKFCSVYYKCSGNPLKWEQMKCDSDKYFDIVSKSCVATENARTVNGCDRCEYKTVQWVNAVDDKCQKYYICKNGQKIGEGSCKSKEFFNEYIQACISGTTSDGYDKKRCADCTAAGKSSECSS